jgi:hypothetical protein
LEVGNLVGPYGDELLSNAENLAADVGLWTLADGLWKAIRKDSRSRSGGILVGKKRRKSLVESIWQMLERNDLGSLSFA